MQWRLNRQYSISIGIAIAVLLALGYVAGTTMRTFLDDIHLVERTHEVLETAQSLRASIKGASSARRGYALTQDAGLAQEFYESLNAIDEHLLTLESATSKSPRQHSALAELKPLVAEYTALLHEANRSIREGAFSVEEQAAYIRKTSELDQRLRERLDVFVT